MKDHRSSLHVACSIDKSGYSSGVIGFYSAKGPAEAAVNLFNHSRFGEEVPESKDPQVTEKPVIIIDDMVYFLNPRVEPMPISDIGIDLLGKDRANREAALAKLTPAEIKLLGIE